MCSTRGERAHSMNTYNVSTQGSPEEYYKDQDPDCVCSSALIWNQPPPPTNMNNHDAMRGGGHGYGSTEHQAQVEELSFFFFLELSTKRFSVDFSNKTIPFPLLRRFSNSRLQHQYKCWRRLEGGLHIQDDKFRWIHVQFQSHGKSQRAGTPEEGDEAITFIRLWTEEEEENSLELWLSSLLLGTDWMKCAKDDDTRWLENGYEGIDLWCLAVSSRRHIQSLHEWTGNKLMAVSLASSALLWSYTQTTVHPAIDDVAPNTRVLCSRRPAEEEMSVSPVWGQISW